MDLSTTYLGLKLPHPFMPGASPMVDDLDMVKRLEDAGAAAIVMHSLFEEQITREQMGTFLHTETHGESFAEALCYFPSPDRFALGPEEYLEQLTRIKATVRVPVIASLNGTTPGGWLDYARLMEQAGADALELNVYSLPTDFQQSGQSIEDRTVEMLAEVKKALRIPVAVKLSPFYTSLAHFSRRLDEAGADGLVLFNRFYQADIDLDLLEVVNHVELSQPSELRLPLRWIAILRPQLGHAVSIAATTGVHSSDDVVKALMSGADVAMLTSAVLRHGPQHLSTVERDLERWLELREYDSVAQLRGSATQTTSGYAAAFERANYVQILHTWSAPIGLTEARKVAKVPGSHGR